LSALDGAIGPYIMQIRQGKLLEKADCRIKTGRAAGAGTIFAESIYQEIRRRQCGKEVPPKKGRVLCELNKIVSKRFISSVSHGKG